MRCSLRRSQSATGLHPHPSASVVQAHREVMRPVSPPPAASEPPPLATAAGCSNFAARL